MNRKGKIAHWSAYLRTDSSSYDGGSHFEKQIGLKREAEKLPTHDSSQIS